MSELLITRSAAVFEASGGDGWTVTGLAVPYDKTQRVTDDGGAVFYLETFCQRAFSRDVAKGGRWVNLMQGHRGDEGDRYLGRCVAMTEDSQGLWMDFRIDRSHPQAEQARSGELTGWSVSARVYRSRRETAGEVAHLYREACGLSHVAATASPQYVGAGVLVARDHELIDIASPTPVLDALRAKGFGRG